MPIKLTCTTCQKPLRVKDSLAGKKIACPSCKTVLAVAKGAAVSSGSSPKADVDLDELAVQAIAEQIAAEEPPEPTTVDFLCPQCDAELKLPSDLAGKQAPCPECRRIIRVPKLEKSGPVDWRKSGAQAGPAAGLLKEQAELEDSWSSTATSKVSSQALYEAGALKLPKRKVTPLEWAQRAAYAVTVLVVVVLGYWFVRNLLRGNTEAVLLAAVEEHAAGKQSLAPEYRFDLNRLLASYLFQAAKVPGRTVARDGKANLVAARQLLGQTADPLDRHFRAEDLLADVNRDFPDPEQALKALGETLALAPAGHSRLQHYRTLIRQRLAAVAEDENGPPQVKNEGLALIALAMPATPAAGGTLDFSQEVAALGILGQELLKARRRDLAGAALKAGIEKASKVAEEPLPFLTLRYMLDQPPPDNSSELNRKLAQIVAAARRNRRAEMQERLSDLGTTATMEEAEARLHLADFFAEEAKEVAQGQLSKVREILEPRRDAQPQLCWELCELVLRIEGPIVAEKLGLQLLPASGVSRLRLLIFQRKLAGQGAEVPAEAIDEIQPVGPATSQAVFLRTRLLAAQDTAAAEAFVSGLTREQDVPFGKLGVLFGMLDQERR